MTTGLLVYAGAAILLGIILGGAGAAHWLRRRMEYGSAVSAPPDSLMLTLGALQQRLEQYQTRLNDLDREQAAERARLRQQIETLSAAGSVMTQEARALRTVLTTSSGVRGDWGEAVLENLLTACGLNQNVDFDLQTDVGSGNGLRPDAIVRLPSGRTLAVDAKASLTAFLEGRAAADAADDEARRACDRRFARVLRERARELAGKEYSRHIAGSLPYVVMFVPSEAAFRAALDADPELFLYGQGLQPAVMLASPSTLFPLLCVVAQGWRQQQASEDTARLLAELQEFGGRLQTFLTHVQKIGKGLDDAGRAFNAAVASFRTRLAPSAARLRDLGAGWAEAGLKPVEQAPLLAEGDDRDQGTERGAAHP